ncbi:hypothetical protein QLX08_005892 [Tetragonisca angustula]|uniref:Uncharacterized protein n=1 Tax=Tetragonisca angustula TaxID=166442 RepID=A0AAW0ZWG1_9HYME
MENKVKEEKSIQAQLVNEKIFLEKKSKEREKPILLEEKLKEQEAKETVQNNVTGTSKNSSDSCISIEIVNDPSYDRIIEVKDNINHIKNRDINIVRNVSSLENSRENQSIKYSIGTRKEIDSIYKTETFKRNHSNNVPYQDNQSKSSCKRVKNEEKVACNRTIKKCNSRYTYDIKSGNTSQNIKDTKSYDRSSQDMKLDEKEHENNVTSEMTNNNSLLTKPLGNNNNNLIIIKFIEQRNNI